MTVAAERVRALFDDAADLPESEREAFVERACAGDRELAGEVRRLLAYVDAPTPAMAAAVDVVAPPARLGRFELRGKLGEGGMGVVYRALDHALEREVALKLVSTGGRDAQARLLREAMAMARVAHPNVVPIFDVGVEREQVFLAMELVAGATLTAWLRAAPRDWRETLRVLVDAGRGLAAAHRAGLLHRDVKPDNILVGDDGRVRIVDFGLARADRDGAGGAAGGERGVQANDGSATGDDDASGARADGLVTPVGGVAAELTRDGAVVGTPGFMAPEQLDGSVSVFSDQWSFAATAYYALFGALPWTARDLRGLREAVTSTPPRPPPRGDVAPAVVDAILRGLARFPEQRFASVGALLAVLEAALVADPEIDRQRFRRQRRGLAIAMAIGSSTTFVANAIRTGFRFDMRVIGLLLQTLVGLLFVAGTALGFRRALLRTAYDRRMMTVYVAGLAAVTLHRALQLDVDPVHVVRGDAVIILGMLALAAMTLERWLVAPAAVMLAQLGLSLAVPATTVATFGPALMTICVAGVWFWREPAADRKRRDSRELHDSS